MNNFIINQVNKRSEYGLNLNWKMTDWCNYQCKYCKRNKLSPWIPYDFIIKVADQINIFLNRFSLSSSLTLVGGEVTYYDLEDLLKNHLTSKYIKRLILITNLSRDLEYFKNLKNICELKGIILILRVSVHLTQIKDMNEFMLKLKELQDVVRLNIVLNKENYEVTQNFLNLLISKKMNNNVDLLFDQRPNERSDDVFKVYNNYSKSTDINKKLNYEITLESNEILNISRADLGFHDYNFYNYKCTGILRILPEGRIVSGACNSHKQRYLYLEQLNSISKNQLEEFLTVTCKQTKCALCVFKQIKKQ